VLFILFFHLQSEPDFLHNRVLRDATETHWNISCLITTHFAGIPEVKTNNHSIQVEQFKILQKALVFTQAFKFNLSIPLGTTVSYTINNQVFSIYASRKEEALRMFYTSCNGDESGVDQMWEKAHHVIQQNKSNLYLAGGDQIYADSLLKEKWIEDYLPSSTNYNSSKEIPDDIKAKIETYFWDRYLIFLKQTHNLPPMIAQLDDHEIFDGYGSYTEETQNTPIVKTIFEIAKEAYLAFQHHTTQDKLKNLGYLNDTSTKIYNFGDATIAALDTRVERTRKQVCSKKTWDAFFEKLHTIKTENLHLMLAIPVVFPEPPEGFKEYLKNHPELKERFGKNTLDGSTEIIDDMVYDPWAEHKKELDRLIIELNTWQKANIDTQIIIESGDVHMAGIGELKLSREKRALQLISSGIGSKAGTNRLGAIGLDLLSNFQSNDMIIKRWPGTWPWQTFILERNFMTSDGVRFSLHTENGQKYTYTIGQEEPTCGCAIA